MWLPVMGTYTLVLIFFLCVGLNLLYLTFLAWTRPPRHTDPGPMDRIPFVTVQLPIFNEMYVVERLIRSTCELDWPSDCLEIQVLDDSTDETQIIAARLVRHYQSRGINITHIHREARSGFKAGALEAGLEAARGEFIAIFDADFLPPRDFLRRTVPYFAYELVGLVQARWGHVNRSYSPLTELQSVIIDAHFLVDQVARNRGGYFMNFNGTAGVWRKTAIAEAGGWQHDTLAEDLDLSYRAQLKGWETVYLPDVVAPAELPITIAGYRCQQRRWASGSFACAIKLLPRVLGAPLSPGVKIQAVLHLMGYASHVSLLIMFLLQPFLLYFAQRSLTQSPVLQISPLWLLLTVIPAMAPGAYLAYGQWRSHRRWIYRAPYIFGASVMGAGIMVTVVCALARVLYTRQVVFDRTPKYGVARSSDSWDGKHYSLGIDPVLALELLLACYSIGTVAYAGSLHAWGSFFYTGYFLVGLLAIITMSFLQITEPLVPGALASPSASREP